MSSTADENERTRRIYGHDWHIKGMGERKNIWRASQSYDWRWQISFMETLEYRKHVPSTILSLSNFCIKRGLEGEIMRARFVACLCRVGKIALLRESFVKMGISASFLARKCLVLAQIARERNWYRQNHQKVRTTSDSNFSPRVFLGYSQSSTSCWHIPSVLWEVRTKSPLPKS